MPETYIDLNPRTANEAIADIGRALYGRVRAARLDYDRAQREFSAGSPERREAWAVLNEAQAAHMLTQRIAGTITH